MIGVDLIPELIDMAKVKALEQKNADIYFYVDDVLNLPTIVSNPVDSIFIANTFHGIPDKESFLRMVYNQLKDNGTFVIINWHKRDRMETMVLDLPRGPKTEFRLSPQDIKNLLKQTKDIHFQFDLLIELPPYHYCIVFKKQPLH